LVSTMVGIAAQVKESSDQEKKQAEATQQTLQIVTTTQKSLQGIERSLSAIDEPLVSAIFDVPCEGIYLQFCDEVSRVPNASLGDEIWKKWPYATPGPILLVGLFFYKDLEVAASSDGKPDWFLNFRAGPAPLPTAPVHASFIAPNRLTVAFANQARPFINQSNGK